jgi:hypothetical protein
MRHMLGRLCISAEAHCKSICSIDAIPFITATYMIIIVIVSRQEGVVMLTSWRRNYFFLILAHTVYRM